MITLALVFLEAPSDAYEYYVCADGQVASWPSGAAAFDINTISFSSSSLRASAEDGLDSWEDAVVPGTSFDVSHGTTSETTISNKDDVNMVAATIISSYAGCFFPGAIAQTEVRGADCGLLSWGSADLKEADIVLNTCYSWTTADEYYDYGDYGTIRSVQQVVLHEAGHAVGLDHTFIDGPATMTAGEGGGSVIGEDDYLEPRRFYANEDDRAGLRNLYPDSSNDGYDVAVQSYVWYEYGSEYHDYCGEHNARPSPYVDLSELAVAEGKDPEDCPSEIPYPPEELATYGDMPIETGFNYLNLGSETVDSVDVRIRMTTNPSTMADAVTVDSFSIGTFTPALPFEYYDTWEVPVLDKGVWYVVAEIDYDDDIDEVDEVNNQAVWNRPIHMYEAACTTAPVRGAWGISALLVLVSLRRRRSAA